MLDSLDSQTPGNCCLVDWRPPLKRPASACVGVDNALVEINGAEVPILDGSAAPIVDVILRIGLAEQRVPLHVRHVELGEAAGLGQRVGQRRALVDAVAHLPDDALEPRVLDLLRQRPPLAYLHPGRFAALDQTHAFPFHTGWSR